jgi:hypothetical protein
LDVLKSFPEPPFAEKNAGSIEKKAKSRKFGRHATSSSQHELQQKTVGHSAMTRSAAVLSENEILRIIASWLVLRIYRWTAAVGRGVQRWWDDTTRSSVLLPAVPNQSGAAIVQSLGILLLPNDGGGQSSRLAKAVVTYFVFRSVRNYYRQQASTGALPRFGFFTLSFRQLDGGHREQRAREESNWFTWDVNVVFQRRA